jgi:GNAT superfamily N-acetyltransferase
MIRPTTPADAPILVGLTADLGLFRPREIQAIADMLDDLHAGRGRPDHKAVCFEEAGAPIGFACYGPALLAERAWYLHWLVVRQDRQGRGVGTALLQYVEQELRFVLHGRILLVEIGSLPAFERTRRFYLQRNYQQLAVVSDYFDDGDDMVILRKRLNYG